VPLVRDLIKIHLTEEKLRQYAALSNDFNPIHLSAEEANQVGYQQKVVHGMLSMAIATRLISPILTDSWFVQFYRVRFLFPLHVNDTLIIKACEAAHTNEHYTFSISGSNQNNDKVISGKVSILKRTPVACVKE